MTEHTRNQIFFRDIQKICFKIFTLVLLDGFLNGFSKFGFFLVEICILIRDFWAIFVNYSMRMLSMRWTNFSVCSASVQIFASCYMALWTHAEHTRKWFHRLLSIRGNDFNAPWAYVEMISTYPEHTRKLFHRRLSIRGNDFNVSWTYAEPI